MAFVCTRAKELHASIVTLLHKVELERSFVTSVWYRRKFKTSASQKDILRWNESFSQLLRNKEGRCTFHTFLQSEFSEENLEFWEACEEYKCTRSEKSLPIKAQGIFQKFLKIGAPKEVNIDHQTRDLTYQQMSHPSKSCFDVAQEQARILMEKDSYPRFLKSTVYKELLRQSSLRTVKLCLTRGES
ncbi:hypothetical protein GDO86_007770 [Hymenochirus boettgeri]|uniref:RGS domain-containing protein n=1 Tax=Hymenochirus boettgeri TaxID=247094 RepID=A0A8T2J0K6_9PIPI|nr:hypothetical protein GDO86_007770 [Hymenochirus boettgeri]